MNSSETPEETTSPEEATSDEGSAGDEGGGQDFLDHTGFSLEDDDESADMESEASGEESLEEGGEAESEEAATSQEQTGTEETAQEPSPDEKSAKQEAETEQSAEEASKDEQTSQEEQQDGTERQLQGLSQEELRDLRDKAHQRLVEEYAITEEDANQFLTEPEKVMPSLAANVHLSVYRDVIGQVYSMLPRMLQTVQQQTQMQEQAEQSFFEKWPQLVDHKDEVARIAKIYRQQHPNATQEQAVQQIGAMAAVSLGLVESDQERARTQQGQQTQPAPAETRPYRPAAPGSGSGPAAPPSRGAGDDNKFGVLAEEFLEEDQ